MISLVNLNLYYIIVKCVDNIKQGINEGRMAPCCLQKRSVIDTCVRNLRLS